MKKLFTLATLLLGMMSNAMAQDAVVPTIHGAKTDAKSWIMTLGLNDAANDYVAFQMDVQLPAGVSADEITLRDRLQDGGSVTIDGSSQTTNFVVEKNVIDATNNIIRIIGYNLGNHEIKESADKLNDGMFKVSLSSTVGKDLSAISATVKDATFVKSSDLSGISLASESKPVSATKGIIGDVNNDGEVDTADKVAVINYYLNKAVSGFSSKAADMNNDSEIDTTDGVSIINSYLNK